MRATLTTEAGDGRRRHGVVTTAALTSAALAVAEHAQVYVEAALRHFAEGDREQAVRDLAQADALAAVVDALWLHDSTDAPALRFALDRAGRMRAEMAA